MKPVKKRMAALLAAVTALSLAGCGKGGIIASDDDFQKNMHQSNTDEMDTVCETEDGFYFRLDELTGGHLYHLDKATGQVTILCAKPECAHNDETCNADIGAWQLWTTGGRLYYTYHDYREEKGGVTNYGLRLHSAASDGTDRKVVQELQFEPSGDASPWMPQPILHRGVVYFPYSGVLYAVPLGGDIHKDAEAIWGQANEEGTVDAGGVPVINTSYLSYTLWADGDLVYFMVDPPQADGTYKDVLFSYDTNTKEVKEVWRTPDAADVGEWASTGVSVSQWYVLDGYIYFYLSGGDFWRSSLENGGYEKLADTHEKAAYGSAVFSDDYLCVLNDAPDPKYAGATATFSITGGMDYVGGDAIYVYGLDGKFVKEISLKPLYEQLDTLTHCELAFCDGDGVYFVADASTWSERVNGASHIIPDYFLYRADIKTGEVTKLCNWH